MMVSGNDLLEWAEDNNDSLEKEFMELFSYNDLKEYLFDDCDRFENFKRDHGDLWDELVDRSFNERHSE